MMATRMPPTSLIAAGLNTRPEAESNASALLKAASLVRKTFCARNSPLNFRFAGERLFAVGEFPVAGHGVDAEQIRGLDHVGALQGVRLAGALQEIAAVEQQRIAGTGIGAQPVDQRFQVGKAAHAAVTMRGVW